MTVPFLSEGPSRSLSGTPPGRCLPGWTSLASLASVWPVSGLFEMEVDGGGRAVDQGCQRPETVGRGRAFGEIGG